MLPNQTYIVFPVSPIAGGMKVKKLVREVEFACLAVALIVDESYMYYFDTSRRFIMIHLQSAINTFTFFLSTPPNRQYENFAILQSLA